MQKNLAVVDNTLPDLIKTTAATGLVPTELQPFVQPALREFRNEMAAELGLENYEFIDKGELPSRLNGKVGGGMTKKMVAFAEAVLAYYYKNNNLIENSPVDANLLPGQ